MHVVGYANRCFYEILILYRQNRYQLSMNGIVFQSHCQSCAIVRANDKSEMKRNHHSLFHDIADFAYST